MNSSVFKWALAAITTAMQPNTTAAQHATYASVPESGRVSCNTSEIRDGIEAEARLLSDKQFEDRVTRLRQIYADAAPCPFWSRGGIPTIQALTLLDQLLDAGAYGLDSSSYNMPELNETARALISHERSAASLESFDVHFSSALLQFLLDISEGRVGPEAMHVPRFPNRQYGGVLAAFAALRTTRDVAATLRTVEPPYAGYSALKVALRRYRWMSGYPDIPEWKRTHVIKPGDTSDVLPQLRARLTAMGDMDSAATRDVDPVHRELLSGALLEGVRHFQMRHGLVTDGVLGDATQRALSVPFDERARQMALTLERWRWLPKRAPSRYVVVNIPAFRLYAFENDSTASQPTLSMSVVVGSAQGRRTPMFSEVMREVVFRPYWDVPPSIARNEIIPMLRRKPGYFTRESLEIVRGGDHDARIYPLTADNLSRVLDGTLRIRQRPGDNNALGNVKFVFPNRFNVYMHGTPAQQLFALPRRDFSHGCIRLENPFALLQFALGGQQPWDSVAMDHASHGPVAQRVKLARPITVFVLYGTTVVDGNGALRVYSDVYGHDKTLQRVIDSQRGIRQSLAGLTANP